MTTFRPISADRYDDMLNVLPPAVYLHGRFMVGEEVDAKGLNGAPRFGCFFSTTPDAFDRLAGVRPEYWESVEPMTVRDFRAVTVGLIRINLEPEQPTIYEALKARLNREPTHEEIKADVLRILREADDEQRVRAARC